MDDWITECEISIEWNIIEPKKRNEILINATIWLSLENITLMKEANNRKIHIYDSVYVKCPE